MTLPLAGVRVLAVEQYGAGPFGTMFLADQGAEVIKIEPPAGGDFSRDVGPFYFAEHDSVFFHAFNRNKKSMTLNLRHPEGKAILHALVGTADALASNLRGDVPEKLGLTHAHLRAHNPRIVCAHLSAYGRTGPRASWPGFDYLMQAEAGWFSLTGEPDGPPARFGLSVVDLMTGLGLSYAVAAGIVSARASGEGRDLDVSLFDMALHNLCYPAAWYLNEGHVVGRLPRSAHPSLTPCPALPHRRRLDLHHVQQGEVLAGAVREARPARVGCRPAVRHLQGTPCEPGHRHRDPRRGPFVTHHGRVARSLRRVWCLPLPSTTSPRRSTTPSWPSAPASST